jgi:sialidase-1
MALVGGGLVLIPPQTATRVAAVAIIADPLAINGTDGVNTYRIPTMAVTANGTIVVTYDARIHDPHDLPNDIDIVERRSTDNGATWTTQTVAVAHLDGSTNWNAIGVGDSSLLDDQRTGRLFLFYDLSPVGVSIFNSTAARSLSLRTTVHPMLRHSDDGGLTWSSPVDLIGELKPRDATGIFASSGHGIQTTDGTLLQPYSYFIRHVQQAALAYSRDQGRTWRMSPVIGAQLSENKVVQLADGTLLDDARPTSAAYRMVSRATCVTCGWSVPAPATALPDPQANGDLQVPHHPTWLIESNLADRHRRVDLTVRLSTDNGATWPTHWTVCPGPAGYSVLATLSNGGYAIAYETPTGVMFQPFSLPLPHA